MMDEQRSKIDDGQKRGGFSFSFAKKKKEAKTIEVKHIDEAEVQEIKTETDYILSLDANKVKSVNPKEEPKELVIPLIQRNNWQTKKQNGEDEGKQKKRPADISEKDTEQKSKKKKDGEGRANSEVSSLESEAVKEIMEDASRYNETWDDRGNEDLNMTIPLLMQNQVPKGYETDDKLDVSIRPDEATEANYEEVPIEQFGMAMLRGMGWKEGEGIGNKLKKAVEPIEVTVRPKGQGLGADKRPGFEKKKHRRKPGEPAEKEKEEEESKGFAKGAHVLVCSGPHKNLYGTIEGVDEDNSRVVIKFALSSQAATLSQFAVQLVTKEEFKKYSKDLGKFSRGHDELKRQEIKSQEENDSERKKHKHRYDKDRTNDNSSRHDKHSKDRRKDVEDDRHEKYSKRDRYDNKERDQNGDRHKDRQRHSKEDNRRDRDDHEKSRIKDGHRRRDDGDGRESSKRKEEKQHVSSKQSSHEKHSSSHPEKTTYWLRPDLRVRFIDPTYKKGKYYNVKVKVVDVITRDTCTCQTDDGRFLEDIHQSMLETLIPKSDPAYIMVVIGKLKGQIGTVLKRDKVKCQADVQLLRERERIIKMDYDIICEFAGNIQDEEDY